MSSGLVLSLVEKLKYMGYFITKVIEYNSQLLVVAKSGLEKALFIETDVYDEPLRKLCEISTLLKIKIYTVNDKYQINEIKCHITPSKDLIRKNKMLDELAEGSTIHHLKGKYNLHGRAYINLVRLFKWLNERKLIEKHGNFVKTKRPLRLEERIEILLKVF